MSNVKQLKEDDVKIVKPEVENIEGSATEVQEQPEVKVGFFGKIKNFTKSNWKVIGVAAVAGGVGYSLGKRKGQRQSEEEVEVTDDYVDGTLNDEVTE